VGYVSVQEIELLSFFEVEPKRADCGVPWPYNDFSYRVELARYVIEFHIAPAYKDLSLSICLDGSEIYKLAAQTVKDVRYHKHPDREVLEIVVSELQSIWLRIRPTVFISQDIASEP
jgi:hypothetical protein